METNKTSYVAPEVQVIDVQNESVLCASVTDPWGGNTEFTW